MSDPVTVTELPKKVWYKSKTVWSTIIAIVAVGYLTVGDGEASVEELLALAASSAALIGRFVATAQLVFFPSSASK